MKLQARYFNGSCPPENPDTRKKITTVEDLVSEMDKDNLPFTLRQTNDHKDHIFTFTVEMFDEVMEAFYSEYKVLVSGWEILKNGNIEVSIFNAQPDEPKR